MSDGITAVNNDPGKEFSTSNVTEKLVDIFNSVREIPYHLSLRDISDNAGLARIMEERKGACFSKHYLLGNILGRSGIKCEYMVYTFFWHEQLFDMPPKIKKMAMNLPRMCHVSCKVNIEERSIMADATWDSPLQKVGFNANIDWNGKSDTVLAVMPSETLSENSDIAESLREAQRISSSYSFKERKEIMRFMDEFNSWLGTIRSDRREKRK